MASKVTVKAPSSTANLGPGFDVFGLALDAFYDTITLTRTKNGVKIISDDNIPTDPEKNTAGLVVKNMKKKFKIKEGLEIKIKKGIPAGFGMGSSAASAAAAAVAFDKLFGLKLSGNSLVEFAGSGEKASAGTVHYDNVAASVLGGFVIVKTNPLDVIRINPPTNLRMCVAVPSIDVPKKKTKVSRGVIPKKIKLTDSILNLSNASAIVAGFMKKDPEMIGNSIKDVIVEPARQHMIPGFAKVKENAIKAGALGVTISGAGPSVIAFSKSSSDLKKISLAMSKGFESANTKCQTIICKPSKGAATSR
ncbi:MAG: homoserine kinase [Nitrosopumilus sp.]|uniref:homoserine kinase n=1 Tax=Nitrosopumilus sp. TaxID=2024843 RepID=UPI002472052E|nr:homoserine kinase [Nitrosopumilus sp.]MDH5431471.1 homoserine kinase [Nitrosopumilus sp.]MDH5665120.1 homoserine kinase [Nitrosopumilus sp.]MDH5697327.1 homoserine kinase [Nitrosopumilus sp.]